VEHCDLLRAGRGEILAQQGPALLVQSTLLTVLVIPAIDVVLRDVASR
jgi:hypothetical protein